MKPEKQQFTGAIFCLISALIYSFFPLVVKTGVEVIPVLAFVGLSELIAGISLMIFHLWRGDFKKIFQWKILKWVLGVTLFIIIIPGTLLYTAASGVTASQMAVLGQSEVVFALILSYLLFKEKITLKSLIGSLLIICGVIVVSYNKGFQFTISHWLLILAGFIYPFGNYFGKKALKVAPASLVIMGRSLLGGCFLIFLGILMGQITLFGVSEGGLIPGKVISENINLVPTILEILKNYYWLILLNALVISVLEKITWYEGLKRLDINKATSIIMIYPALTFIWAILFMGEEFILFKLLGLISTLLGGYLVVHQDSKRSKTSKLDKIPVKVD